ncbi:flagella basal body P-ring formation protein FlgA [Croceicoccus gelatinilyticus]|uniref:flagella basal body P-ring formation protein FlgA n=1 Tax=Croceicoccus gelatinilyticus TaxID=2835536 RepID=UPI001BD0BACB|nr:flagella basal body P-ring formation protein FlgA [Croceicoccus gelatinilyticus]MBS7671307.1 flagella basal body P-ring formation protein FlgA [Croceicoccus gelatinilyticus]
MIAALMLLASATGLQDLDDLDRKIAAFTGAQIGEPGGPVQTVDKRLRLKDCASEPELSWRDENEQTLVVRCPQAGGWRLYVPVRANDAPGSAGVAPTAVHRGDAVSIAISGQGFSISRPGEAMEDGAVGDWIKVRPATTGRQRADIMRARITKPGVVTLATN